MNILDVAHSDDVPLTGPMGFFRGNLSFYNKEDSGLFHVSYIIELRRQNSQKKSSDRKRQKYLVASKA